MWRWMRSHSGGLEKYREGVWTQSSRGCEAALLSQVGSRGLDRWGSPEGRVQREERRVGHGPRGQGDGGSNRGWEGEGCKSCRRWTWSYLESFVEQRAIRGVLRTAIRGDTDWGIKLKERGKSYEAVFWHRKWVLVHMGQAAAGCFR